MGGEHGCSAVLLDRLPLWVEAVEGVLHRIEINVVGKTTKPSIALEMIEQHRPDLFVTGIDVDDPEMDGISCLRTALERFPQLRAVVLSVHEEPEQIELALDAGAAAYVLKSAHPDDLASAVRQVFQHSVYLAGSRTIRARVSQVPAGVSELTRREREILQLMAEGHSNAKLAKMLWVTEQTVKFHLSNIYRKLNVSNRTGAARWAQLHGLLSEQERNELVA